MSVVAKIAADSAVLNVKKMRSATEDGSAWVASVSPAQSAAPMMNAAPVQPAWCRLGVASTMALSLIPAPTVARPTQPAKTMSVLIWVASAQPMATAVPTNTVKTTSACRAFVAVHVRPVALTTPVPSAPFAMGLACAGSPAKRAASVSVARTDCATASMSKCVMNGSVTLIENAWVAHVWLDGALPRRPAAKEPTVRGVGAAPTVHACPMIRCVAVPSTVNQARCAAAVAVCSLNLAVCVAPVNNPLTAKAWRSVLIYKAMANAV